MTNVELYINETLCDIQNPQALGIRLNRVLINPAELEMKDAQYSYSITIPSSPTNDAIFKYINVEEIKNKFNHNHTAQVYVDGVKVFDGRFKLNEIDSSGNFKGNLVVPTPKTVKEIFGDKKMNEVGEWLLDLTKDGKPMGMVEMLNKLNAQKGIPKAIFPLVLYGLLPKVPKDAEGNYSDKDVWDNTVRLGAEDFPPSINCLQAIKHIFESTEYEKDKHYEISGTAFQDPKLTNLYMSYSNPTDYEQPWNWGHLGKIALSGTWKNCDWDEGGLLLNLESQVYPTESKIKDANNGNERRVEHMAVDLFNSKKAKITVHEDAGYNCYQYKTKQNDTIIEHTNVKIPVSGYYKVMLTGSMELVGSEDTKKNDRSNGVNGVRLVYADFRGVASDVDGQEVAGNLFHGLRGELKVLRTRHDSIEMNEQVIDGTFYQKNFKQSNDSVSAKDDVTGFDKFAKYPKYFPQENSALWVDPYQNKNFVCGLQWGKSRNPLDRNPVEKRTVPSYVMAAKSGISWSTDNDDVNYCVTNSSEYWTYKPIKNDESDGTDATDRIDDVIDTKSLGYVQEGKLAMQLNNAKPNVISRRYTNEGRSELGEGSVSVVIWLEKGEQLTVVDVTDKGLSYRMSSKTQPIIEPAYIVHQTAFKLTVEPYKKSIDWATVKMDGTGLKSINKQMAWNEPTDFAENNIDLAKFLPKEPKVDEWINSFCKTFNLDLIQPQVGQFQLNTKRRSYVSAAESVLDLSQKVNLSQRNNQPLGLPSNINLSFKINKEEEGYDYPTRKDEEHPEKIVTQFPDVGNGSLQTGSLDGKPLTQTSNFSYNWYKNIKVKIDKINYKLEFLLPIISNKEAWIKKSERGDYAEMQKKIYTNLPQRFWYRGSDVYNMGALWKDRYEGDISQFPDKYRELYIYPVKGSSEDVTGSDFLILDYKDQPNSILRSYFTLISTDDSNYTEIECFLTPDEYERLSLQTLVSLNSDLYYIASIDGYDPVGKNKTKLKLIRKI